ncbi:MAG: DUF47 family protein [Saprospiraceae bacterium]|nr:DUF47 family protein [Saprospiraceae bacterium]
MFRGILPKEVAFYDYFEKMAALNLSISQTFLQAVEGNANLGESVVEIKRIEHECENTARIAIDLLHRTFITPFDRDDIYTLLKGLDSFSGDIKGAASRLALYKFEEIRPETIDFAQNIHESAVEIDLAVKGLRKIKKNISIRENCLRVHDLEFQSDEILSQAISNLFITDDILLMIKWKEIYGKLEKAVDRLEKVACIIESIIIDNS